VERERRSRVAWYNSHLGGNLEGEMRDKLSKLLDQFGIALEEEARKFNINIFSSFPIFREFHLVSAITTNRIMYVTSPSAGGSVRAIYLDLRKDPKQPNIDELCQMVHDRYGWTHFWHVQFQSDILQRDANDIYKELLAKAKGEVQEDITRLENEAKLVRINPIFKGRDFLVEDDLCFVLMPFQPPFYVRTISDPL